MIEQHKFMLLMILYFSLTLVSFPLFANSPSFEFIGFMSIWFEAFLLSLFVTICMLLKNTFKIPGVNKIYFKSIISICLVSSLLSLFIIPDFLLQTLLLSFILIAVMLGLSVLQYLQKKQPIGCLNKHKFWVVSRFLSVVITLVFFGIYVIYLMPFIDGGDIFLFLFVYLFMVLIVSKSYFSYHNFQKMRK